MKQQDLGLNLSTRRTRKAEFLDEMELVVPWRELISLIMKAAPPKATGRPPFGHEIMLRLHFLQLWFGLSDFAMEEALFDVPLYRAFAGLDNTDRLPNRVSILRFRHLLEQHGLAQQILATVNATQTKKGNQWHLGMKAHVGVDADSGLVHTVTTTAANAHDVTQAGELLHGAETDVFADSGYRGVEKREEVRQAHPSVNWHVAMMPSKRRALDKDTPMGSILEKLEKTKASIRAKVEHPFRVIKRQFGHVKVRYRGLAKNTAQLCTLFALSNLWMARKRILNGVMA